MLWIAPLFMSWRCQVPRLGYSFKVHHMVFHHCGEHCQNFKYHLDIIFIRLGTLCHHQAHKYLSIQAMDHLVYDLQILGLFDVIFPRMGFFWQSFLEALISTLQWSFNPTLGFVDIIMWKRILKFDKPPCTILQCCNNNNLGLLTHLTKQHHIDGGVRFGEDRISGPNHIKMVVSGFITSWYKLGTFKPQIGVILGVD